LAAAEGLAAVTTAGGGRAGEERRARRNLRPVGETQLLENELVPRVEGEVGGSDVVGSVGVRSAR
jgi:hypothetical protein